MIKGKCPVECKNILDAANEIYFLGFGFLRENLQKIGLLELNLKHKDIYGTGKGLLAAEINRIKNKFPESHNITIEDVNCTTLLKKYFEWDSK